MTAFASGYRSLRFYSGHTKVVLDRSDVNRYFHCVDVIEHQKLNQIREAPYTKPDGEQFYLSITSSFIHEREKPIGVVMLFDDVTEVRELHERERRILEERNRLHRERVESLNNFATSIAHQLRNPLVTIGGFAKRMYKANDPECQETIKAEFILK